MPGHTMRNRWVDRIWRHTVWFHALSLHIRADEVFRPADPLIERGLKNHLVFFAAVRSAVARSGHATCIIQE